MAPSEGITNVSETERSLNFAIKSLISMSWMWFEILMKQYLRHSIQAELPILPRRIVLPTNLHKDLDWWSVPSSSSSTCPAKGHRNLGDGLCTTATYKMKIQSFNLLKVCNEAMENVSVYLSDTPASSWFSNSPSGLPDPVSIP